MINNPVVMDITMSGSDPVLQSKSVSPSESNQTVTPDAGYDGLSQVSVSAIQTETKTVTANGTVTPSSGKYLKQVTVNVPTSGGGIDTSDATATAEDMAAGKTAYAKGEKITGSLDDYQAGAKVTFGANYTEVSNHNDTLLQCRGLTKGAKILRDGSYADVYVKKGKFGDATAEDVAEGKTFTSAAGLKVTGTHVCSGGINTSDATATADDIAEGVTAYVNGEKITGDVAVTNTFNLTPSLEKTVTQLSDTRIRIDVATTKTTRTILEPQSTIRIGIDSDVIGGDATPSDVARGKTFTSAAGFNLVGTAEITTSTLRTKTVTPSASIQTVVPDSVYDGLSSVTVEGDANLLPENIKSGISIFGVTGSYEGSGGSSGSSDNNCEAYHITSTSATLSFKTSGTIKVWGYGYKTSTYNTTMYSFVGDGYYTGKSYGTPSKTTASFSIGSDGTLSGLPSGLTGIDVLVTIGV